MRPSLFILGYIEMGKYLAKKQKKNRSWLFVTVVILALILALLIWVTGIIDDSRVPVLEQPTEPDNQLQESTSGETTAAPETQTETAPQVPEQFVLSQELEITLMGGYAGIYMEDGSDEIVSDVMMIVLKNTSDADLQLARIDLIYEDFVAEFEVTNLPAGESVVLLEKNRRSDPGSLYEEAQVRNVVFFSEPMSLSEDNFEISGNKGSIELTNISEIDVAGDIYIYYKNSASDLLYGGITYRARIEGGLAAGETARVITGHYDPDNSVILDIVFGE